MYKFLFGIILNNKYLCLCPALFIAFSFNAYTAPVVVSTLSVSTSGSDTYHDSVAKSGGMNFAFPDVCKTPNSGVPIPIPYPNMAQGASLNFSNVKNGDKITVDLDNSENSKVAKSSGDEAGVGGLVSIKNMQEVTFKKTSSKVKAEGAAISSHLKMMVHNSNQPDEHQQIHVWDVSADVYLFTININPPDNEPLLYPVMGRSNYSINSGTSISDPYQLVEIKYMADYEAVKGYLDQILADRDSDIRNGFDGMYYDPDKTVWVFISSQHDNWLYREPVLKDGNIWFEGVAKDPSQKLAFSAWLFYLPKELDFKVRIKTNAFDTELGRATLLSERFKIGAKKPSRVADFDILCSGAYFDEERLVYAGGRATSKKSFGVKSYADNLLIEKGDLVGFSYIYRGTAPKSYTFRVIPPGGAQASSVDLTCIPGKEDHFIWQFSKEEEMVEGAWKFQITDGLKVVHETSKLISLMNSNLDVSYAGRGGTRPRTLKKTVEDKFGEKPDNELDNTYKQWEQLQSDAEDLLQQLKKEEQTAQTDRAEKILLAIRLHMQKGKQWHSTNQINTGNRQLNGWLNQTTELSRQAESSGNDVASERVKKNMQSSMQRLGQMMNMLSHILKQAHDVSKILLNNTKG